VVVGHHEVPIGRHARVGVVDDAVLEREGDPARTLGQGLLEVRADLLRPVLEPVGRPLDHLLKLVDVSHLLLGERQAEVEREVAPGC
jgi:hypothetical protein